MGVYSYMDPKIYDITYVRIRSSQSASVATTAASAIISTMPLDQDHSSKFFLRNLGIILSLSSLFVIAVAVYAFRANQKQPTAVTEECSSLPCEETGSGQSEMVSGK